MNRNARNKRDLAEQSVSRFNSRYAIGTLVEYWTGDRTGSGTIGQRRSAAVMLKGRTAVIYVTGSRSYVALSNVAIATEMEAPHGR